MTVPIDGTDIDDLARAKRLLETTSLAARLGDVVGQPLELALRQLPSSATNLVDSATHAALERALDFATWSLGDRPGVGASERFHKLLAVSSGAAGGAFGLPALAVELPISTTIMLRSIADIARSEGSGVHTIETRLDCMQVLAFGSPRVETDDAGDTGYLAVRAALAKAVSEAVEHIARRGVAQSSAPVLVRFLSAVGARFGIVVTEKAAMMAVPVLGAAGGAVVNTLFMDHYQTIARGHFVVRRLERKHGIDAVLGAYRDL